MHQTATVIERVTTENGEIQLQRRGSDYEIIFNGTFLMATYNGESEKLLVSQAIEAVKSPRTVLIAGLGVGFSLGEALGYSMLNKITVVEIEKKIIEWNRTHLAEFSNYGLLDPRVEVVQADFIDWMSDCRRKYDVICLDIDNGPDWLVMDNNGQLYDDKGIRSLLNILNESGAVSFWSAAKSDTLEKRLRQWFDKVKIKAVDQSRGEPDYIYVATGPKSAGRGVFAK
jgi:spermidine synthase